MAHIIFSTGSAALEKLVYVCAQGNVGKGIHCLTLPLVERLGANAHT